MFMFASSITSGELRPDIRKLGEFLPDMTRISSLSDMMEDWRVPDDDLPSLKIE